MSDPSALSSPSPSGVVAMTAGGPHAWIMINALRDRFGDVPVVLEEGEDAGAFWARRKKLLGARTVTSMKAARIPIRLTKRGAAARQAELVREHGLKPDMPDGFQPIRVPSVNSPAAHATLKALAPKVVFVVSTRLISKATLATVTAPFINYHSGITPAYRGMYGGYFAMANGEPELFGSTVHLIDAGVDTGDILYQSNCPPARTDTFHTYLWVQAAGSRDIVIRAVEDALDGRLKPFRRELPSRQYYAPTFGGYVWTGLTKGVW